jgi:hypothetical protein
MRVAAVALSAIAALGCMQAPSQRSGENGRSTPRAGETSAGGRFFARTDTGEERPLALRTLRVRAATRPGTVRSHLVMEIAGPRDARVEAVMRLLLPRGAAVTGAVLWVDGRPMNGVLVDRGRAEKVYRAIVAQRRDPALVTWDGPGWVKVSIFPVEQGEARRFELEWVEPAAVGADGQISYRVPIVSDRGRPIGRAALEVDGRSVDDRGRDVVTLAPSPAAMSVAGHAAVVAGRIPGDPFAPVLVRGQRPAGLAPVVILAETSAAMTAVDRAQERATIAAVLRGLPQASRVSLLAVDWDVQPVADDVNPSAAIGALARLDAIVSAGALNLDHALVAAAARVRSVPVGAVLFVGRGTDVFGDDAVRAPLTIFRRTGAPLSAVTLAGLPGPLVEGAALTGGEATAAPVDADGLATLLRALGPAPSRPQIALRGFEDWRPLETIDGQPVWMTLALGGGAAGAVAGDAADLAALCDRARLPWFDGRPYARAERKPALALTAARALLVLEHEEDYARNGLPIGEQSLEPKSVQGNTDPDAMDVLGGLVKQREIGEPYGVGGLGGRRAKGLEVIPGQADVRGGLEKEMVRRIIRRHINEVRFCYEQRAGAKPHLAGELIVRFAVGPSGAVMTSALGRSTLGDAPTETCVVEAVKRWEFPRPAGGGAVVWYPFLFGSPGDEERTFSPSPRVAAGDPAVGEALAILAETGPLDARLARVASQLDLPATSDAEGLAWTIDRNKADVELIVLVARLLVAADRTRDAVRVLSERAASSPDRVAAELRRIGQPAGAAEVLARAPHER